MGYNRLATSVPDIWSTRAQFLELNTKEHDYNLLQLSALYRNMGLSNCILGMGNLTGYVHVPVKDKSFWKRISIKYNFDICFVGRYFWRHGETSKFCVVCNEPVLSLLVCLQDRPRWS